jgi:hypothetical protein
MKRNVSVVRFNFRCNILISGKITKEMPGSVASGTHCTFMTCVGTRVGDILLGSCKERQYVGYSWRSHGNSNSGTFFSIATRSNFSF